MIVTLALMLTWQSAGLGGINVNALAFDGGSLYAATDSGIFMRSGGSDWGALQSGSFNTIAANNAVLYAGGNGVVKSSDAGRSWTTLSQGWDVSSIVLDGSAVYVGTRDRGILKSSNGGATWIEKPTGISAFVIALAIDANTVYAGTNRGVLKSLDGGDTWRQINNGITIPFSITSIVIDSTTIFAATPFAGVFRSDDRGESWVAANGPSTWVSALALQNRTIYAGTPDQGIFRSQDRGATWTTFNDGLPRVFVHALVLAPGGSQLYAATSSGVLLVDFAPRSRSIRRRL